MVKEPELAEVRPGGTLTPRARAQGILHCYLDCYTHNVLFLIRKKRVKII